MWVESVAQRIGALIRISGDARGAVGLPETDAEQAIRNAVVPGCYIVPNGSVGVSRAPMAGCDYFAPG